MFIHGKLGYSTVNGPGERAVVWFQGCVGMKCPGCWNPETHRSGGGKSITVGKLVKWICQQPDISGVTFSGGEPLQQPDEFARVVWMLRKLKPELSIGVFTGYTESELNGDDARSQLWRVIQPRIDFAVMGRYNELRPANSHLCSSQNQHLRLFSKRYTEADFAGPLEVEVTIDEDLIQVTGFPVNGMTL